MHSFFDEKCIAFCSQSHSTMASMNVSVCVRCGEVTSISIVYMFRRRLLCVYFWCVSIFFSWLLLSDCTIIICVQSTNQLKASCIHHHYLPSIFNVRQYSWKQQTYPRRGWWKIRVCTEAPVMASMARRQC